MDLGISKKFLQIDDLFKVLLRKAIIGIGFFLVKQRMTAVTQNMAWKVGRHLLHPGQNRYTNLPLYDMK